MALHAVQQFGELIDRRNRQIVEMELASQVDQIASMFTVLPSDSQDERRAAVGELPTWDQFSGNLNYARITQQFNVIATHLQFAQGLRFTRDLIDDDLSGIMRGDRQRKLVRSGVVTRQQDAVRLFQFATSNDVKFHSRGEALPLASNAHTTNTAGVSTATGFDNLVTAPLSRTALRAARIQMRKFRNDVGQITNTMPTTLVVPLDLTEVAQEILLSPQQPESGNNAINPEARHNLSIMELVHWNDANDWALTNMPLQKENCYWYDRITPEYETIRDFETKQVKFSGYMRYSYGVLDWRWLLFASVS